MDPSWQATATTLGIGVGDLAGAAAELGVGDWPTDDQLVELAERSKLVSTPLEWTGSALDLTLPMPSAVLVELSPRQD